MKFPTRQIVRHLFLKTHNLGTCNVIAAPGKVSDKRWTVPDHITKPPYYETLNKPSITTGSIEIKNAEEISAMRGSCKLAANILKKCSEIVKVNCCAKKASCSYFNSISFRLA